MKRLVVSSLVGIMSIGIGVQSSQAFSIRSAQSVTTNLGSDFGTVDNIRNKNGLLTPYVENADLSTYLATSPKHTFLFDPNNEYYANQNRTSGNIDFNFGEIINLNSVVLWNEESQGIKNFQILTSNVASFTGISTVNQGSFVGVNNPDLTNYAPQVYTLGINDTPGSVFAQYVRLQIADAYNDLENPLRSVAVGEVAFGFTQTPTNPVPFEFSPALGVAALGVVFAAKKLLKANT